MGAATGRAYWGAWRLWREVYEPTEVWDRGELQEHKGVDRKRRLVLPASANSALELRVRCLVPPNPSSRTQRGLVALLREQRHQLTELAHRSDPLVWVEDDTAGHTVTSYAAPTITKAAHGLADGDVVLLRDPAGGAGAWLLGTVQNATTNTYEVASLDTAGTHTPAAGTEVWLVEAYWRGAVLAMMPPPALERGAWWARELTYGFKSAGTYSYARTAATAAGS